MGKKTIFVIGLLIFIGGTIFAEEEEIILPKNVIAIDLGYVMPCLVAWGITGNLFLVTAIQYERQILENFSLGGRFDYRIMSISDSYSRTELSSFSFETHARYYPGRNIFFLDGMLGYAGFIYFSSSRYNETIDSISHYFKLGGKLGWRIDFGKPGGFILEPSIGYYGAIGSNNIEFYENSSDTNVLLNQLFNQLYEYIIKGFFIGGTQFSLCFGYRF